MGSENGPHVTRITQRVRSHRKWFMCFLGQLKRSVRLSFIKAKKSAFTEPHVCASIFTGIILCHVRILSRYPTSHPHISLTQVMLTLEDDDMKGYTWAIAPALTALGYLLIVLVAIFPFWVRLVNEESREVFFSGLFENCFHIKCWKPRPLSSKEGQRWGLGRGKWG